MKSMAAVIGQLPLANTVKLKNGEIGGLNNGLLRLSIETHL